MGQPIDKSKGPRRSSSSESGGLHNGDLAPTESQQVLWRGLPDAGQSVCQGDREGGHDVVEEPAAHSALLFTSKLQR